MIALDALNIQTFRVAMYGGSLFRMGISAVPFLIPLMFQIGLGYTASSAGLVLMAVFAGNLLWSSRRRRRSCGDGACARC